MYSRNMKNSTDEYPYPFTLPERYGGSRFRKTKEPEIKVHSGNTTSPPPLHRSPMPDLLTLEETEPNFPETYTDQEEGAESRAEASAEPAIKGSSETVGPAPSLLSSFSFEDLLLAGLILLLSHESGKDHDNGDIMILLALLLAYRQ